jgi:hypothetical protein
LTFIEPAPSAQLLEEIPMRPFKVLSALALVVLTVAPLVADEDRAKVPDADAQAKSLAVIKDLFKEEFAKKKPADMLELSDKLLKQALETKDDPASQYVLYREAVNLAAGAGETEKALAAVEEFAKAFQISAPELKAGVFEKAATGAKTAEANRALAEDVLQAVAEAIAADDFDNADRLIKVGESAAKKS